MPAAVLETLVAYLDPASGSLLVQLLLGGLAAVGVFLKLFWQRVVSIVRPRRKVRAAPE